MNTPSVTLKPPYYAVIFTSIRTDRDRGYTEMAKKILDEAQKQDGFLGFESARNDIGVSVSYWNSLDAIQKWKENSNHRLVQQKAKEWYKYFRVRVCKVEKEYGFS